MNIVVLPVAMNKSTCELITYDGFRKGTDLTVWLTIISIITLGCLFFEVLFDNSVDT